MTSNPPKLPPIVSRNIAELLKVYRAAARNIEKELYSAALTDFRKFRLGQHKTQIDAIVAALNKYALELAKGMLQPSYETGTKVSLDALIEQGVDAARDGIDIGSRIHTQAVSAITDQMALDLISANQSLERQAKRILRLTQQKVLDEQQINQQIARGVVQGESRREVSSRLANDLRKRLADGAKVEINGRKFDPEYYAELIARTRTREAVTEGITRAAGEFGVHLFQVSVHDNPCEEICQQYQGKVFSLVDGEGFPVLEIRPPWHPNCKHTWIPYVPKNEAEKKRLMEISQSRGAISDLAHYREALEGGKLK